MGIIDDVFSLRRMNDLRADGLWPTVAVPFYSVSGAASSINEGSALTINVTGSNIVNGTYYWTIDSNAGDFATSSGSFTITSNAGSFTVTPTADTTTEGAETFTVSIRSGSTSGTILATTSTITINDTSTTPPLPTVIGQAYGGGYYAGQISTNGNGVATHYLIVADKSVGHTTGTWGTYGVTLSVTSEITGPTNSATMAAQGSNYSAAQFCENLTAGGYTDWYLPARKELAAIYCNLKPGTATNDADYGWGGAQPTGINSYSIPQRTASYPSTGTPTQTTATNFRTGASSQEFEAGWYWCSTSYAADNRGAWGVSFNSGGEAANLSKNGSNYVRAVRRIPV